MSGRGRIHSFVVFHRAYHPSFADELPYVVAVVELEEGPRLLSNVVEVDIAQIRCGMRVRVIFEQASPTVALPKFVPEVMGEHPTSQHPDQR